ncbi:hypothetical protein [Insolitispirillum peregrinum]|uniref:Uncharacterized protein n=1 Tax=Insolitispirillum peregrinum TaxID=80876 RepID=A0A1N7JVY0_9PROT|nr:hypothetical protein [Insolitispirillum peregrinum]SIS53477.1 hypothetical protein SAMN05421779_102491 [Insolitispirillum peregrinum]
MQTVRSLRRHIRSLTSSLAVVPLMLVAVLTATLAIASIGTAAVMLSVAAVVLFSGLWMARRMQEQRLAAIRVRSRSRRR